MQYRAYHRSLRHYLSMPFIYIMIVPLVILDIFLEIYHHVCFPLYGLQKVSREQFIRIDRHKLRYLIVGERFNCAYCGYANGLIYYAQQIIAETEKYWCGVQHKANHFSAPPHHKDFVAYGDEKAYKKKYS